MSFLGQRFPHIAMRSLLASIVVLAVLGSLTGCTENAATQDDLAARAAAAGLSPTQADSVAAFGHPVLSPATTDGFELVGFDLGEGIIGDFAAPYYSLHYRHEDGACVSVSGDSEGLGGLPWTEADHPPVTIPALGAEVWILEDTHGPPAEDGGIGARGVDWIALGGSDMHVGIHSYDDAEQECRPLDVERMAAFVASLRPIAPAHDEVVAR